MIDKIILVIIVTTIWVVSIIKGIQYLRLYMHGTVPNQLMELVRQAHLGQQFNTLFNIEVSDEMRTALCAPLTQQQIQTIRLSKEDIISHSVDGYVISHKVRRRELSGVVSVSIDITSKSGNCNYKYSGVKLRITVNRLGDSAIDSKWTVTSVTQM